MSSVNDSSIIGGMRSLGALLLAALLAACRREGPPVSSSVPASTGDQTCAACGAACRNPAVHRCGWTELCRICDRDAGPGHACRATVFCASCGREAGRFHRCGLTRPCWNPECSRDELREFGPNHDCAGRTRFCPSCGADASENHNCSVPTAWCPRCGLEVILDQHVHGLSRFCPRCRRERIAAEQNSEFLRLIDPGLYQVLALVGIRHRSGHDCRTSRFCRTCRAETDLLHQH